MRKFSFVITLFISLLLGFGCRSKVTISNKEAGVVINEATGHVYDQVLKQGKHKLDRQTQLRIFDITEKRLNLTFEILSKDGFNGSVDLRVVFAPNVDDLPRLFQSYGINYIEALVVPEVRSLARHVLSSHNFNELDNIALENQLLQKITSKTYFEGLINIRALLVHKLDYEYLAKSAMQEGLDKAYSNLRSPDKNLRIRSLTDLINSESRVALEIIFQHWSHETDSEVKNYILNEMIKK